MLAVEDFGYHTIKNRPRAQQKLPLQPTAAAGKKINEQPRIFLGSSGKQTKLLKALTRGLEEVARVEPWTTSFNPGTSTLERLVELTREVDFAAFGLDQQHARSRRRLLARRPGRRGRPGRP